MPAVQTISSQAVIAKVYRDFRPNNSSWTSDAIEWIGEGIRGIRSYFSMKEMGCSSCKYKIYNKQGLVIPVDSDCGAKQEYYVG